MRSKCVLNKINKNTIPYPWTQTQKFKIKKKNTDLALIQISILTLLAASFYFLWKSLIFFQNHINKGRVTQRGIERDFLTAEWQELRLLQRKTRVMNVINGQEVISSATKLYNQLHPNIKHLIYTNTQPIQNNQLQLYWSHLQLHNIKPKHYLSHT